jgi:hypothetical protein
MKSLLLLIALLSSGIINASETNSYKSTLIQEPINSTISKVELKVRAAAVKVHIVGGGHGSGSYLIHKGFHFILTAQHVAEGVVGSVYMVSKDGEYLPGILAYSNEVDDMAVLYLPTQFTHVKPMKYKPIKNILEIGREITYSGYPSSHTLMTIRGRVAGYELKDGAGKQIILHTYGWFGCSGSVMYDEEGAVVGVLWGVDIAYYPSMAIVEDMIWVAPIQKLNIDIPIRVICKHNDLKFC